jgi:hypothetical protein
MDGKRTAEKFLSEIRAAVVHNRRKSDKRIIRTMLIGLGIFVIIIVGGFLII